MIRSDRREHDPLLIVEPRTARGVGGLLLGLAVGAGAALLLAPASGRDTRARLRRAYRDANRRMARDGRDTMGAFDEDVDAMTQDPTPEHARRNS